MHATASPPAARHAPPTQAGTPPGSQDWLRRWCATPGLLDRLRALNELVQRRLPSYEAAEAWLQLLARSDGLVTPAQMETLVRQFLLLAPDHAKSGALYDLLMNSPSAGLPQPDIVFMITSCERYLPQARRVLGELRARGAQAVIVVGDAALPVAQAEGDVVRLPVADSYEALLHKVLEGLTWLRRSHGPQVCIAKVDDDVRLDERFNPAALAQTARLNDYVGQPHGLAGCDRLWHMGKTMVATPPYGKRRQGHFAYGPMYLLGPRAIEHLVREWLFYPGEFAGCIAEDRAVGDTLRRAGMQPWPMRFEDMGCVCRNTERLVPAGTPPSAAAH